MINALETQTLEVLTRSIANARLLKKTEHENLSERYAPEAVAHLRSAQIIVQEFLPCINNYYVDQSYTTPIRSYLLNEALDPDSHVNSNPCLELLFPKEKVINFHGWSQDVDFITTGSALVSLFTAENPLLSNTLLGLSAATLVARLYRKKKYIQELQAVAPYAHVTDLSSLKQELSKDNLLLCSVMDKYEERIMDELTRD